jgi:hypothetical protein
MTWTDAYKAVQPYIVKIETPAGSGTGFFFAYNEDKLLVSIATALHVVQEAEEWRLPLKIRQVDTGKELFVAHPDRAILPDYERDTAVILLGTNMVIDGGLTVPDTMLPLFPSNKYKAIGTELGWVGYPAIAPLTLCLFRGGVSAFNRKNDSYYLDGVAINGVSGGPVFEYTKTNAEGVVQPPKIVGIVSAYHYNRQSGGNLPGLLMVHDATHLNAIVEEQKSLDEARKKAAEDAAKKAATPAPATEGQSPRQESGAAAGPGEPEGSGNQTAPGPGEPAGPAQGSVGSETGPNEPQPQRPKTAKAVRPKR